MVPEVAAWDLSRAEIFGTNTFLNITGCGFVHSASLNCHFYSASSLWVYIVVGVDQVLIGNFKNAVRKIKNRTSFITVTDRELCSKSLGAHIGCGPDGNFFVAEPLLYGSPTSLYDVEIQVL